MKNQSYSCPQRKEGFMPVGDYAAIGEGRSVALIAPDGSIDWWAAPNLDSKPLFDRLLDSRIGGFFSLTPVGEYDVTRQYRAHSNVLETCFTTKTGSVRVTESINSTLAGRLPWSELARRIEGVSGEMQLTLTLKFGTAAETRSPWRSKSQHGTVFHIADLMAMLRTSEDVHLDHIDDEEVSGTLTTRAGSHSLCALLVAEKEPLAVPPLSAIDQRIETSDIAWRDWVNSLTYHGAYSELVKRSALSLKFLWYSPTGALAAAATTSLPEGMGKEKNYDYRYAWVRDACLIIRAFIQLGALEDCKAAFSWLSRTIIQHGVRLRACYTLEGEIVPAEMYPELEGYQGTQPVRTGNNARDQMQLSMYGDLLGTAREFVAAGHVLDLTTSRLLGELANCCADSWRLKDSGIWELPEEQHYTHSKMACWMALDSAIAMAREAHIEPTWIERWTRERDRISEWVEKNCWSDEHQSYLFYVGADGLLDASLALVWHYGNSVNPERMTASYRAIERQLGAGGSLLYRYSGVEVEEAAFIACAFWLVEAWSAMDQPSRAQRVMQQVLETLDGSGNTEIFNEMYDVKSRSWRGNIPQGLSHLALIFAAHALPDQGESEAGA